MTDVFFSYSSKDRERVRPIREALIAEGFDVFWDQEVPPGSDWDEWIRHHLNAARCVIVFWSQNSVQSRNVKHEAKIAEDAGKLIPAVLDHLEPGQFPMGHYTIQAVKLPSAGGPADAVQRLIAAVEEKAVRAGISRQYAGLEARVASLTEMRENSVRSEGGFSPPCHGIENAKEELRREEAVVGLAVKSAQRITGVDINQPINKNRVATYIRISQGVFILAGVIFVISRIILLSVKFDINNVWVGMLSMKIPDISFILWVASSLVVAAIGAFRRNVTIIIFSIAMLAGQLFAIYIAETFYKYIGRMAVSQIMAVLIFTAFYVLAGLFFKHNLYAPPSRVWNWGTPPRSRHDS